MKSIKIIPIIVIAFFCGCATVGQPTFSISVDSLASPLAQSKKTYLLIPGNDGVTWDDLQFQEYALYLMRVLNAQGFISASSAEEADLAIILAYGIGDPQTQQYSFSLPTYGQTGIASAHTYGTASTTGNLTTIGNQKNYSGSTNYSGTTTYTPTYGITGYRTVTGTKTTFFRYAIITAYDFEQFKNTEKQVQLWQTTLTSTGSSGDLRRVFPLLIGASVPYLATSTGQQVNVSLHESDAVVKAVKGESIE